MIILDNMSIQQLSSASYHLLQANILDIDSINIIFVLYRNLIPNDDSSLLNDLKHVNIVLESSYRVFMYRNGDFEV